MIVNIDGAYIEIGGRDLGDLWLDKETDQLHVELNHPYGEAGENVITVVMNKELAEEIATHILWYLNLGNAGYTEWRENREREKRAQV